MWASHREHYVFQSNDPYPIGCDKFLGFPQQFRCKYTAASCTYYYRKPIHQPPFTVSRVSWTMLTIPDLIILDFTNVDQNLSSSIIKRNAFENGRSIVGDGDLTSGGRVQDLVHS